MSGQFDQLAHATFMEDTGDLLQGGLIKQQTWAPKRNFTYFHFIVTFMCTMGENNNNFRHYEDNVGISVENKKKQNFEDAQISPLQK